MSAAIAKITATGTRSSTIFTKTFPIQIGPERLCVASLRSVGVRGLTSFRTRLPKSSSVSLD